MESPKSEKVTVEKPPQPASADLVEQRASEIARREGRPAVTDHDRRRAYDELRSTGQKNPSEEDASH